MAEFILRHYDASPFSEKPRVMFGLKGLAWRSVIQPSIMPKPDLVPLTGAGGAWAVNLWPDRAGLAAFRRRADAVSGFRVRAHACRSRVMAVAETLRATPGP